MKPLNITFVFSTRNGVFPPPGVVDAPNFIGALILQELVKRGHCVTLYASRIHELTVSKFISGKLNPLYVDFPIEEWSKFDEWTKVYFVSLYDAELLQRIDSDFKKGNTRSDVVQFQNHSFYTTLPYITNIDVPKIFTLHNPIAPAHNQIFSRFLEKYPALNNCMFIPISKQQAAQLDNKLQNRVIPHGIDIHSINFKEDSEDYFSFVGRLSQNKGSDIAVEVAQRICHDFIFTGRKSTESHSFFDTKLKPYIDNNRIKFIEKSSRTAAIELLSRAKTFLFPVQWEEPFGLVMIESMATGTPVIAFARGSVPEVIKDGETGYIVNSSDTDIRGNWVVKKTGIDGLCEAVERIYSMPDEKYKEMRRACRAHVEKNFTVERMVDEYEKVYEQILSSK